MPGDPLDEGRAGIAHGHQEHPVGLGGGRQVRDLRDPAEAYDAQAERAGGRT
jgi:hypothetical protein